MTDLFLRLARMSVSAGWLVLAVMAARLLLKKGPRWVAPVLWGLVAVRLVFPFSVESVFSLIPRERVLSARSAVQDAPVYLNPAPAWDRLSPPSPAVGQASGVGSAGPEADWLTAAAVVWLVGAAILLGYALLSYVRLARRMRTAVRLEGNVWQSEFADSPFVLGFFRPRIYLPFRVRERDVPCVIAHERAHIARWDHRTKILGFFLLAVYWFHPLMWAAWLLFCRDLEAACDERVIRDMGEEERAEYSAALLACSAGQRLVGVCPVAFGELSVKKRVDQILRYQKPALWIIVLAVVLCAAVAVCFLTDPVEGEDSPAGPESTAAVESTGGEERPPAGETASSDDTPMAPGTENGRITHIVDPTKEENFIYATAEQPFFEDEDNVYSFGGIYSEHVVVHYADGTTENITAALESGRASIADLDRFGVGYLVEPKETQTRPIQPPALTEQSAKEFLAAVLNTLRVHKDGRVTFSLPPVFPAAEGKECDLRINLNATYTESPGVSAVQRLLERKEGWKGGDTFEGKLDESLGTVRSVSLWAAFLVEEGGKYTTCASDFFELTARFEDEPRPDESVSASEENGRTILAFTAASGEHGSVSLVLPAGWSAGEAEFAEGNIVSLTLLRGGETAAGLRLIPFATNDRETLNSLDPAENTLPMPIFAGVALSNHAGYEDYTVCKSTAAGASATARYVWQDLTGYGGRAPDAPWQSVNCVLAYDTDQLLRFAEIVFAEELLAPDELRELAESFVISG